MRSWGIQNPGMKVCKNQCGYVPYLQSHDSIDPLIMIIAWVGDGSSH